MNEFPKNQHFVAMLPDEIRVAKNTIMAMKIMAAFLIIFCIVLEVVAVNSLSNIGKNWWVFLIPVGMVIFVYTVSFHKLFKLPSDYANGKKVVEDTEVVRVKKLGFFDDDASEGGYSATLYGSVYYLYVKDDTRRSGRRKFRVRRPLYLALHPGDQITISYLPKTGLLRTVDCGSYHYIQTPVKKRVA